MKCSGNYQVREVVYSKQPLFFFSVHLQHFTVQNSTSNEAQTDIIGAMLIVWRVRGKVIKNVLCNIVCNNYAQCNVHT